MSQDQHDNDKHIFRIHKTTNYTCLLNKILQDKRMTFEARGLLAFLLSKPPTWKTTNKNLYNESPSGKTKIDRVMKELVEFGHIVRRRVNDADDGTIRWETDVHEEPITPSMDESSVNTEITFSNGGFSEFGKPGYIQNKEKDKVMRDKANFEQKKAQQQVHKNESVAENETENGFDNNLLSDKNKPSVLPINRNSKSTGFFLDREYDNSSRLFRTVTSNLLVRRNKLKGNEKRSWEKLLRIGANKERFADWMVHVSEFGYGYKAFIEEASDLSAYYKWLNGDDADIDTIEDTVNRKVRNGGKVRRMTSLPDPDMPSLPLPDDEEFCVTGLCEIVGWKRPESPSEVLLWKTHIRNQIIEFGGATRVVWLYKIAYHDYLKRPYLDGEITLTGPKSFTNTMHKIANRERAKESDGYNTSSNIGFSIDDDNVSDFLREHGDDLPGGGG